MAEHKFKVGDVVQLVSGGPPMAVTGLHQSFGSDDEKNPRVQCCWFADDKSDTATFPEAVLIRADSKAKVE